MATAEVSLGIEEYLNTSYSPDREYIDGELLERNAGKWDHARVQWLLTKLLSRKEDEWGVLGSTEQRTRVASTRVRIPDVVLVRAGTQKQVLTEPPLLVIEILSPDDSYRDTERRAADYLAMGVEAIWLIDPDTRTGRQCVGDTWTASTILRVPEHLWNWTSPTFFSASTNPHRTTDERASPAETSSSKPRTSRSGFSAASCS